MVRASARPRARWSDGASAALLRVLRRHAASQRVGHAVQAGVHDRARRPARGLRGRDARARPARHSLGSASEGRLGMCGINGYVYRAGRHGDTSVALAMNAALAHRGPDEGGAVDAGVAALAMRRLSIVDVRDGHQPLRSDDDRFALVYNGEIYDSGALRDELRAMGHVFHTRSDTEVILHAFMERGLRSLASFNGMFAFAICDRRDGSLVLARDPLGIKPLYWWSGSGGELVFSSELRSLLAHPSVPRKLDHRSLEMLLVDRYVADPWTMLEGVKQLPPGHWLRWRDGEIEIGAYDRLELRPEPMHEADALAELRTRLDDSIRSQLVADVPVGVFLSGGIDSSTVAAYAARAVHATGERLKTFSIGFDDPAYDESSLARHVAQHLGTDHRELRLHGGEFELATLDRILDHVGQPLGDTSCIPTLAVSELAASEVKVALSGDGGDELFGGYDHMFWAARMRLLTDTTPAPLRRAGSALLSRVAPFAQGSMATRLRRARKGLELSLHAPLMQFRLSRALWQPAELEALCTHAHAGALLRRDIDLEADVIEKLEPEELVMLVLARTFMPGAILQKVDRMSMAASLEVRPPLLDRRIVEFAARVPLELKIRGRTGKYLLRQAGRDLLPKAVYSHRKQGFALPLQRWFNAEFWDLLEALYAPGTAAASLFRRPELLRVLDAARHAERSAAVQSAGNSATRVWMLAALGRWMQRYGVAA
ncbi:MAG: asparagine synthase (glutamine-hydrolyzing) [Planctomycetes bacterium]|nr:asparagine synthase (glutamine-hydrolyzing) [Planctomycetota bacterium]